MSNPIGICLDDNQIEGLRTCLLQAQQELLKQKPELAASLFHWADVLDGATSEGEFDPDFLDEAAREQVSKPSPTDDVDIITNQLCQRASTLGYGPEKVIWSFVWDDIIHCLTSYIHDKDVRPDELTDEEITALLDAGDDGLKGESLNWHEVVCISFDDAWPARLRKPPTPYVEEDYLGLYTTRIFWQCRCGRINTFRQDRCDCRASRWSGENACVNGILGNKNLPADLVALVRQGISKAEARRASKAPDSWLEQAYEDRSSCGEEI